MFIGDFPCIKDSVYIDEGISGTNTKRREGFKEMITDALDGKIDLIVTKSVSRFVRNTVDSLVTIRKLKENGVECYFEKEGIYTFDLKKYEALTERYEKAAAELERLQSLRTARSQQDKKMALYIRTLKKQPEVMHDWNDTLWTVMIEKVIVHKDGQITFVFQNGTEIKVGA